MKYLSEPTGSYRRTKFQVLDELRPEAEWSMQLRSIWEYGEGTSLKVAGTLCKLYNFGSVLKGRGFLHEFSHQLYGLALVEMTTNPKYQAISIPFDHPANGNYLSESFATVIERLLCERLPEGNNGWDRFKMVIDEYDIMVEADNVRNQKACSLVDNAVNPKTLFEASRSIHFILSEEDEEQFYDSDKSHTKWGEPVNRRLTYDEVITLTEQVFEIIQPVIKSVKGWLQEQNAAFEPHHGQQYILSSQDAVLLGSRLENVDFHSVRKTLQHGYRSKQFLRL